MDTLNRWLVAHRGVARLGWLALVLLIAACEPGSNGGGGDGAGDGGDGY